MICADPHCPRCNPETLMKLLQCEAKTLLSWPLRIRQAFLVDAAKKRGVDAINRLKSEMERQWKMKVAAHTPESIESMAGCMIQEAA